MINSYKQITGKYLKTNMKRTLLTIIGIILSVALIASIGLFFKSVQVSEIEAVKSQSGSFHIVFTKTNDNLISKVMNNPKVSKSGFIEKGEKIKLSDKISATEIISTDKALELLPYKAKEGKLPQNINEIAVEKWILNYIAKDAKVGSKIKVNNKEYTLSGVLEDSINTQKDSSGIILTKSNVINKNNAQLLVEISSKANLKETLQELKQIGEKDTVVENESLITAEGAGNGSTSGSLYMVIGIIIAIVVIATIAVIYNAFQISVVERMKQFGLLRAVGATPKQIRSIVLREATILAWIGVPIGLLCGVIAIYSISFAFTIISKVAGELLKPTISPYILGISALVGIVAIYISALIPAYFAGRISPLAAISSRTSIKKEKIKKSKNIIVGKLLGFEGVMAAKSVKRNRRRYRVTVFSIVISVVLFITFKSFTDMSLNISSSINESKDIHFSVIGNGKEDNSTLDNNMINQIKSINFVEKLYKQYSSYSFKVAMDKNNEIQKVKDLGNIYKNLSFQDKNKILVNSDINIYDSASMEVSKKYLTSGDINIEKLNNENGVILINKNVIYNSKTKKSYYGPVANLKVGDEILLQSNSALDASSIEFGKGKVNKVKIMAILKDDPFYFSGNTGDLKLITTEEMGKRLVGKSSIDPIGLNIGIKDIKNEQAAKTQIENVVKTNPSLQVVDNIDQNRTSKSSLLMIQILMYGFVIVISLISCVNIINTITTNIILRRREFAILKCIGLTQKGLRKMIVLEGLLYGTVGTIYGSIIGTGFSYWIYSNLNNVREFGFKIPWSAIAIAAVCALAIGYLSVLGPLSRINKGNLIDTVREEY